MRGSWNVAGGTCVISDKVDTRGGGGKTESLWLWQSLSSVCRAGWPTRC